jgi:hypothetical protein
MTINEVITSHERIFSSTPASVSTLAPLLPLEFEYKQEVYEPASKKRKLEEDFNEDASVRKPPSKKRNQVACPCAVCELVEGSVALRKDKIWLYNIVFEGHDLKIGDRICDKCYEVFRIYPCTVCKEPAGGKGTYLLTESKLPSARVRFKNDELQCGRLCFSCGHFLNNFLVSRKRNDKAK